MAQRWEDTIQLIGYNLLAVAALLLGSPTLLFGQQHGPSPGSAVEAAPMAIHVLGLEKTKRGSKGSLAIANDTLQFHTDTATEKVRIPSIQDVFISESSKPLVGGKTGTAVKLAMPYQSSRALSLFTYRTIDILTLEYRDSNGGFHGVIFKLPKGRATEVKRLLVQHGAHVSMPPEALNP